MRSRDTVRSGIHAAEKGLDVLYCIGLCCDYMADAAKKAGMKRGFIIWKHRKNSGRRDCLRSKQAIRFCSRHPAAENLKKQ